MQFATTNLLTVRGYSQENVKQMLETRKAWTDYLKGKGSRQTAVDALEKAEKQPWFELAFMPKASKLTTDPERNSWRKEMDEDAVAAVRKVKLPLLVHLRWLRSLDTCRGVSAATSFADQSTSEYPVCGSAQRES